MGAPAVVLTFHPHPSVVLRGPRESFYLTSREEKAALLGDYGVDVVITHAFNEQVASIKARDFINQLDNQLNVHQLLVGHDFAFGHRREGNVATLKKFGAELGFTVQTIDAFHMGGEVVSSTRIRRLLEAGQVEQAGELLGRPYALNGIVEQGDGRGRSIGIPTANLSIPKEQAVPGAGVYAVWAVLGGKTYQAVSNVGVRPTFETSLIAPRVEAHILDFDEDIYGEEIELIFLAHLRGEQRFPDAGALVAQIHADINQAREVFTSQ
jgi:riboflavin kinase/FMN adenylyltransferase